MKKNIAMRLASGIMLASLLSTCVISGTFAKYTTSAEAEDTARVAQWGVNLTASSNLFDVDYDGSVISVNAEELVAPGTASENVMTITLTGTPEVSVNVAFTMTVTSDVCVKAGDYEDYTQQGTQNFNVATNYYPVVFTLKNGAGTELVSGNLDAIAAYFNAVEFNKDYAPKQDLAKIDTDKGDGTYKLSWAWDFDNGGAGTNDKADTLLGYAATTPVANVSTNIEFNISIKVTQVN